MNTSCIVLNGDLSYLCTVEWKRAIKLVLAGKVNVLKYSDNVIKGVENVVRVPLVVALIKIVRKIYTHKIPFNKKNVLVRDNYNCNYCGIHSKVLTIDHVIPRSRGGKTNFENCVACCRNCNNKKASMTPREAGMILSKQPFHPTISEFMRLKFKNSGVHEFLIEAGIY